MAALSNRWSTMWKLNEDPKGILGGVLNREFRLKPANASGKSFFEFIYEPEDQDDDPFKHTKFYEWGSRFPPAPMLKLKRFKTSERDKYRDLIENTFGKPTLELLQLHGEKIVLGKLEWLTIFLSPNTTEWYPNSYRDLIYVTCRTSNDAAPDSFRRRMGSLHALQDGTAHGNPK